MNEKIVEISMNTLADCLGLKSGETFLVVTDESRKELAEALHEAGKRLGAESMLAVMTERAKSGEEPPEAIAAAMTKAQVVVCITKHSLTHTQARKQAAAAGARLATMPGITEDMFLEGAIAADYTQVKALTEKVTDMLTGAQTVRIEKDGRSLEFSIQGRDGVPSTGMYLEPGQSGNLPSGEAYIAPIEGTAEGQIVVDGSIAGIGKLSGPIVLTVEKGRLTAAEGDRRERSCCRCSAMGTAGCLASSASAQTRRPGSPASCWKTRRCTAPSTWPSAATTRSAASSPQACISIAWSASRMCIWTAVKL